MKPLMEYAPFKIGERFEDSSGDVLEVVSDELYRWIMVDGASVSCGPWCIRINSFGFECKPLDRTSEALDELAQLDADEICRPKPWRDMTDEEKAPILLAWADGKSIEWWDDVVGAWCDVRTGPQNWDELSYRIAPDEVRGSVVKIARHNMTDYRITFDTINGEPVLDSIKMERLK